MVFESSNGDVATVDAATGKVTLLGAGHTGTTTITATVSNTDNYNYPTKTATCALTVEDGYSYLEWDGTKMATKIVADDDANRVLVTNTTTILSDNSKVYVVKGDVDISANVSYTGSEANNTKVVLCDGAKLKINGRLCSNTPTNYISIYAQSEGKDMGELSIEDNNNTSPLYDTDIKIYGGKISVTSKITTDYAWAIGGSHLYVYGGDVTAKGSNNASGKGGHGISAVTYLYGNAKLTAIGGTGSGEDKNAGSGISGSTYIYGNAQLTAIGGDATSGNCGGGHGLNGELTINDNAHAECQAGKGFGTGSDGIGVNNKIHYLGGTFVAVGKHACYYGIQNESTTEATFEYSTDGTTWSADNSFTLTAGASESTKTNNPGLRTKQ